MIGVIACIFIIAVVAVSRLNASNNAQPTNPVAQVSSSTITATGAPTTDSATAATSATSATSVISVASAPPTRAAVVATLPPTNTRAPSKTFTPTDLPSAPPTNTRAPTQTPAPTQTYTSTPTDTPAQTLTPSRTPTSTLTPTNTLTPTPTTDAVTTQGFNLLNGPGPGYLDVFLVGPNQPASIIQRSDDNSWLKIRYYPNKDASVREGWIPATSLQVNISLVNVPVLSAVDLATIPVTNPCTAVVGDSVANGGAIFEIPDTGYVRTPMAPISSMIAQQYRALGVQDKDMKVFDRSVGATGISSANHPSYYGTPQYAQLKRDHCKFTVILPWINDLSPDSPDPAASAPNHGTQLLALVQKLLSLTEYGRIIVMNYYVGNPTPFALKSFATGFKPDVITAFNQQIAAICAGPLSAFPQVTCLNINTPFAGMGTSYVVGPMTREQINPQLVSSINDQELAMYNSWADGHPGGLMRGDGVHLSRPGKQALASFLVTNMRNLPDLKPYYGPTRTPTQTPVTPVGTQSSAATSAATTSVQEPSPTGVG